MFSLYQDFLNLIPDPSLQVGTVVSINDGISKLEMPGGGFINARGSATVGQMVFVRGGVLEGTAQLLPVELIEV